MSVWNRDSLLIPAVREQLGLGYCKSFGAFIHVKAMQTLDKPLVSVVLNKEMKFSQI